MKKNYMIKLACIIVATLFLQGCILVGIKQLSRNNLNEETISTIIPCKTTEQEIVKLFRKPTDDFMRKQGTYDVYIYKGFGGRTQLETQTLEILINEGNIVAGLRFNDESDKPIKNQCK